MRDNQKVQEHNVQYWFKRKTYGYGWTPNTLQGWLVVIGYILSVAFATTVLFWNIETTTTKHIILYLAFVIDMIFPMLYVCTKKGPSAKWQWGKNN